MLDAIKGKLQSVQSDISEGLRHLRNRRPLSQRGLSSTVSFHLEFIDANAGSEILQNYNESWRHIHDATAENAKKAGKVDADLQVLVKVAEKKADDLFQLQKELLRLNAVSEELSNLITETAKLEGLCEEVESSLAYLDVLCHAEDSQNINLEQRFRLALYRERKMAELNEAKVQMAMDFTRENERLDRRRIRQQEEKSKVLQEAAEKDINTFKSSGVISNSLFDVTVPSFDSNQPSGHEEDTAWIRLASQAPVVSSAEQHALEEFLSDVKSEDSGIDGDSGCRGAVDANLDQDSNGNDGR